MIAEAGLAALWLAAALAALQLWAGIAGARAYASPPVPNAVRPEPVEGPAPPASLGLRQAQPERPDGDREGAANPLATLVRPVAVLQALCVAAAFACLIAVFLDTDLSVKLVADNSHVAKPWLYKFAGAWGNHEGSMLLWVTVLALCGAGVALFERQLTQATRLTTLAAQAGIALGFYAFLLIASNPFARLDPAPAEGSGLNPLLQDPGLAFHPPTLYFGYVGLSIAYSFALGALMTGEVGPAFARAMRPWVLGAWVFLTLGITAGSYWAYYELGWGGWWFWDPVENASLMPWLAATALLHSVTVVATRDGLRAWTVMLAVVAFSMSMVGTFLVRSGILTSVHAFAVDPSRGSFILGLLALYIGGALALFALRIGRVREGARFDPLSREGALVANNLLLTTILGIVLIGTLYPLLAEAVTGEKLSVGPPYFNAAAGPIALVLIAIMAAGPLLRWRRDHLKPLARRLAIPAAITLACVAFIVLCTGASIMPVLGLALAAGVGVASLAPLWGRNLRRTPLFTWGMVVAHVGVAVSVAGMASESAFTRETLTAARFGEPLAVGPYHMTLNGVEPVAGPNWTAIEGHFTARRGEGAPFALAPQARSFSRPPTETNEAAIATRLDGQLYVVLGRQGEDGRWQVRLWWKPFVTLIWAGGALIAIGGVLSLIGRVTRERAARERVHWA
ncbi:heme lyase CcmF/NrfE family subunit [Sphingomonas sp. ID0503]|uniref:heme lyase CcmF/NrfE family subunit n=1 Tax=Sphingomonas sp. ID0503 TaxID=3399691 RepID=UPI003AFACBE4